MTNVVVSSKVQTVLWKKVIPEWRLETYLREKHEKTGTSHRIFSSSLMGILTRLQGHRKRDAVINAIKADDVFFPNMEALVTNYGRQCETCSIVDPRAKKRIVKHPIVPDEVLAHVQLDATEFLQDVHGKVHANNLLDLFSKFLVSDGTIHTLSSLRLRLISKL